MKRFKHLTEIKIKELVRNWLNNQRIPFEEEIQKKRARPDFLFSYDGFSVALETKGHANHGGRTVTLLRQIRKYMKMTDLVIVVAQSQHLPNAVKDANINLNVLPFEINDFLYQDMASIVDGYYTTLQNEEKYPH